MMMAIRLVKRGRRRDKADKKKKEKATISFHLFILAERDLKLVHFAAAAAAATAGGRIPIFRSALGGFRHPAPSSSARHMFDRQKVRRMREELDRSAAAAVAVEKTESITVAYPPRPISFFRLIPRIRHPDIFLLTNDERLCQQLRHRSNPLRQRPRFTISRA